MRGMMIVLMMTLVGCSAAPPEVIVALDRSEKALANAYQSQQERGELAAKAWAWSERERVSFAIDAKTIASTDDEGRIAIEEVRALLARQEQEYQRIETGLEEFRESTLAVDEEHGNAIALLSVVRDWLGLEPAFTPQDSRELRAAADPFISEETE